MLPAYRSWRQLTRLGQCRFALSKCWHPPRASTRLLHQTPPMRADVQLTREHYPVTRGSYSELTDDDLQQFRRILDDGRVVTAADELDIYNTDWWRTCRGESRVLLKPRTTEEVSRILRHCNDRRLAVCPQGGNTAVVGNGVPVFDEVIVSTQLMNRVLHFDEFSGALTCEAGLVLEALDTYVSERGYIAPVDLGAKGSCQIGGNVSTNAGGLRLFRYGNLHGTVLGLEAVLADGEVVDLMSAMKKDNTGYDLKQLFIGSEGTLGFVTKVVVQCPAKSNAVSLAFLGLKSFEDVLQVYRGAKSMLGEILSSCEFIDQESIACARDNLQLAPPLDDYPCNMLIETSGSDDDHDKEKLTRFLEHMMEKELVLDGTLASNSREMTAMWTLRESIPDALLRDGYAWLYDVSLPHHMFYESVEDMRRHLSGFSADQVTRVCGFGHLGDGNIHLNVTAPRFDASVEGAIEPHLFEWTAAQGGSISAEHGIGFKKRDLLHLSKTPAAIRLMKTLKAVMDPNGILNPYKVLPSK
ncbi:D-2-hydroxyglutarate dehydrogenase, mitochondrial-like [Pollicipes pollicipes]|uniref:D-2-hydroxyglutarate dehydrogenase, mitochondrial-like n=1 Tax=Pollicipes pollicipes TaxID=41117 RepID=UPI0018859C10|nr:D-2-hydroxyglutarate dehydrogenase, mitochondrial-like [Pollicipes pollicipes]